MTQDFPELLLLPYPARVTRTAGHAELSPEVRCVVSGDSDVGQSLSAICKVIENLPAPLEASSRAVSPHENLIHLITFYREKTPCNNLIGANDQAYRLEITPRSINIAAPT